MNLLFIDLHCDATMPSGANEFGGGNTYSRGLLKGISENENIFCVYVTRKKYKDIISTEEISDHCFIERIILGDSLNDKDTLQNHIDVAIKEIKAIINKYNLKNFIIHSSYWQSGLVALQLSREYCTQYIHTIQSNGKKKKIVNSKQNNLADRIKAEKEVFENAKYLICSSKAEQQEIHNLYNISLEKLILTGLPIAKEFSHPSQNKYGCVSTYTITNKSTSSFLPSGYKADFFDKWWVNGPFVYYGRLHIDKGIVEIIEAWNILFKKYGELTPPLWIVGGVPMQIKQMRDIIIKRGIDIDKFENQQKIIWWGTLTPSELSCLLTKSMVLVTHSKYESGGLMIIEALACSTPVIASNFGYAKDYIRDWYNGFLVDYGNIFLLAMRMSHFVENPYLSDILSINANFTYQKYSQELDFVRIHFDLYNDKLHLQQDSPILSENSIKSNLVLGYQNTPNAKTIDNIIKNFLKCPTYDLIETCSSTDSNTMFIKSKNREYRIDIWLTTLNTKRFLNNVEPYLITSTDKIKLIISLQNLKGFLPLEYYSVENNISIIPKENQKNDINLSFVLQLMNDIFYCSTTEIAKEQSLSEKISNIFQKVKNYKKYFKSEKFPETIIKVLKQLERYNMNRQKLCNGVTPYIDSVEKIYNKKLYGVCKCSLSEYGHNIAIAFRLMRITPSENNLNVFNDDETKSTIAWYAYLMLEDILYKLTYFPTENYEEDIEFIIKYLK